MRGRTVAIFLAGLLAGAFAFYALAWRTGALVPGHWLTLPTRDAFVSARPTPRPPIPTIPIPRMTPAAAPTPAESGGWLRVPSEGVASAATLPNQQAPALVARAFPVPPLALVLPVSGSHARELKDDFEETRGGTRRHEAIDILAPRGTPVLAAVSGPVAKLFTSQQGGLTVYQFDAAGEYCYYYAHLDRYAPGLAEGMVLERGDRVGDVGTTGNAPKDTPHLHFAMFRLGPDKKWWEGEAVNPFPLLQKAEER
jgi:murein DD-endopeptidase MepM/ murein hydrolase activator NlpD